jgi:hypothetical protein
MQEQTELDNVLAASEQDDLVKRWEQVQARFVDEPQRAVEDADALVAEVMQRVTDRFAEARGNLEESWTRGEDVDTEELRLALRRYRWFFRRLLSV